MHAVHICLALVDGYKGLLDAAFSHPKGLHLRTVQHQARFIFFFHKIIVKYLFIIRNKLLRFLCHIYLHAEAFYAEARALNLQFGAAITGFATLQRKS